VRPGGTIPGIMLLLSSRKAQTSFLEERMKKTQGSPHTFVSDYPLWVMKDPKKFTMVKFSVEVGDRTYQSRILDKDDPGRTGSHVVTGIPGEFLQDFREDVDEALRNIAGIATLTVSPLIRDRQSIYDAVRDNMIHPFTKPSVTIDYQDDVMLDEFFVVPTVCHVVESQWRPKMNPTHSRFIHGDIGLSADCAGIAMGHVSGMVKRQRMKPDGTVSIMEYPFIVIDFMLQILPPPGSEIDLAKMRGFILYLAKMFNIVRVTFDGYQSAEMKQNLIKSGIEADIQSIDKTDKPYLALRNAHFERRLAMYSYSPYIEEVLFLERDVKTQKVDHPKKKPDGGKGSKDVSDAVAGVVFACMSDNRAIQDAPIFEDDGPAQKKTVLDPKGDKPQAEKNKVKVIGGHTVDFEAMRSRFKQ